VAAARAAQRSAASQSSAGAGDGGKVVVGKRMLRFDGGRIVFGG